MANATSTQLQELYVAYFGRAADPTGLEYWTEKGISTAAFAANMYAQPEFKSAYGTLSTESQVNQIYKNLFDRDADVTGLTYWTKEINLGNLQLAEIATHLVWAAQNNSGSADDKTALTNRTNAAIAYTAKVKETVTGILAYQPENDGLAEGSTFAAGANITAAKAFLATIDKETVHTDSAIATSVATITTNGVPTAASGAKTLTLTTTQDTLTGGDGNDKISGVVVAAGTTGTTFSAGDVINGASGIDTLTLSLSGSADGYTLNGVVTTSVEKVLLSNFDTHSGTVTTVDATLLGGLTTVGLTASGADGDTTVTGLTALTNAEMKNGSADLTLTHDSTVVAGSSDAISLEVSNVSAGTFTAAGIETLTINSVLAKTTLTDVVIDDATALTITGDANLTISGDVDFKDATSATAIDGTIDASAFTGGLTMDFATGDVVSVTGGSGADKFDFTTGFAKEDVVDGGAGADTLVLDLAGSTLTKTEFANVSNVETLEINSTNDSATVNFDGVSSFTNVKSNANVAVVEITGTTDTGDDLTYTLNGTTTAIATASDTDTAVEIAAEIVASIDALSGFSAVAVNVDGTGDGVQITNTNGGTIEFTDITNTTVASDVVEFVDVSFTNVTYTNLGTQTLEISSADTVTASLKDASGSTDTITVNLTTASADKAFSKTINEINIPNVETITINTSGNSANTVDYIVTTLSDNGSTDLNTLNITGSSSLDLSGTITASDLTTVDASAFTGDLKLDGVGEKQTITSGSGADEIIMAANLDNDDTIDGGSGTDKLTATTTGLTATTGALSIANIETLNFTNTSTSVIDASKITGATEIAVLTNTTSTTITGLAAGVKIGAGHNDTDGAATGLFDISLADATGTADSLTFNLNDTTTGNNNSIEVKATGIETVTFDVTDDTDTSNADATLDVDSLNASSIIITGSTLDAGNTINLGTLDTDTTSLDTTGYAGIVTATSGSAIATTYNLNGDVLHNITGSSKNDTFTVGKTTNADMTIDGNGGTDVLNMTIGTGAQDFDSISDIDTINFTVSGSAAVTTDADAGALDGIIAATAVNFTGGNALSTVTLGGSNDSITTANSLVLDFSGYSGAIGDITYAGDAFDDGETGIDVSVTGSSLKDTVSASYDAGIDASVTVNMTAVETFDVAAANSATELVLDMAKVTGLSQINLSDASSESIELNNLASGVVVDVVSDNATATTVEIKQATTSGTESQTVNVFATEADDAIAITMADVETLTIKPESAAQANVSLANVSMTASADRATVNFIGTNDVEITATNADINTIDASGMGVGGAVIQTARSSTEASTYTGSAGGDTFIMANVNDTIAAGAGDDTLDVNFAAILGGLAVDLSAATNQVTQIDGGNTSTVSGFEHVNAAGYTGSYGARITGRSTKASTVTGTPQADVINFGSAVDTFVWDAGGNDVVNMGAGADIINITDTAFDALSTLGAGADIDGAAGTDVLTMTTVLTGVDADFVQMSNVETLALMAGSNTITWGDTATASSIATIASGSSKELALTQNAADNIGSKAAPLEITGYQANIEATVFDFLATDKVANQAFTGFTLSSGVYTRTDSTKTVTEWFSGMESMGVNEVGIVVIDSDTYVYAEGAATASSDDAYLKLTGVSLTAINATHAAATLHIT